MWLRSGIAVAVVQAGSYSSDLTPSLGTSLCLGCGPKKQKIKIKNEIKYPPVTLLQPFRSPTQKHPWISMYSSRDILHIYKQIRLYTLPQRVTIYTNVLHISHVTMYFGSFLYEYTRTTSFFSMIASE